MCFQYIVLNNNNSYGYFFPSATTLMYVIYSNTRKMVRGFGFKFSWLFSRLVSGGLMSIKQTGTGRQACYTACIGWWWWWWWLLLLLLNFSHTLTRFEQIAGQFYTQFEMCPDTSLLLSSSTLSLSLSLSLCVSRNLFIYFVIFDVFLPPPSSPLTHRFTIYFFSLFSFYSVPKFTNQLTHSLPISLFPSLYPPIHPP